MGADAKRALRVLRKGPAVATTSARPFPPCMRRHLRRLHEDHHLRNTARFQLTLFFKGVDLTADETLAVWRSQFAHGRFADFQREHRHHVRHAYGLEGKMADYPPHPCEKLARREAETACPFAGVGEASTSSERVGLRAELSRDGHAGARGRDRVVGGARRAEGGVRSLLRRHARRRRRRDAAADAAEEAEEETATTTAREMSSRRPSRTSHSRTIITTRACRSRRGRGARGGTGTGAGTGAGRRGRPPARRHLAIELEGSESETEEDAEGNPNAWHGAVNELTW